jgi:GxxExxY protein
MREEKSLPHAEVTRKIIQSCLEVMKELGAGFLENVYKNALYIVMKQKGMNVLVEQKYEVTFREHKIGKYIADLVVENLVIVELKCSTALPPEYQAQVINYLKASGLPVGLLVNFGNQKLEYKRLHHPNNFSDLMSLPWEKVEHLS